VDDECCKHDVLEFPVDHVVIQQALNRASRNPHILRKSTGHPLILINYGKAIWIPNDESED